MSPTLRIGAAIVLCFLSCSALAEQSLRMPKASQALLLDATRVDSRLLVAGDHGHILYSDDAGQSWQQAEVPTRRLLTALHFATSQRGWAVGHDGMIVTTADGGKHWTVQRDGLAAQQRFNEEQVLRLQRELAHSKQALVQAETVAQRSAVEEVISELELDLEDAQALLQEPVVAPPLLDVFFTDELRGVAVGAFNTLLRTRDGGVSWQRESALLDNPDEYHLNAVTGDEHGTLWIAAESGLLFRSSEDGRGWERLDSPYSGSWFGIARAPTADTLLVFGLRGHAFRSQDNGDSWQPVVTGTERTLAGGEFVSNLYVLLVGAVGTLLVSDDAGVTFTSRPSGERQNLSAVTNIANSTIVVGQGGVSRVAPFGGAP